MWVWGGDRVHGGGVHGGWGGSRGVKGPSEGQPVSLWSDEVWWLCRRSRKDGIVAENNGVFQ